MNRILGIIFTLALLAPSTGTPQAADANSAFLMQSGMGGVVTVDALYYGDYGIEGVYVEFWNADETILIFSGTTDVNGRLTTSSLSAGTYVIKATKAEYWYDGGTVVVDGDTHVELRMLDDLPPHTGIYIMTPLLQPIYGASITIYDVIGDSEEDAVLGNVLLELGPLPGSSIYFSPERHGLYYAIVSVPGYKTSHKLFEITREDTSGVWIMMYAGSDEPTPTPVTPTPVTPEPTPVTPEPTPITPEPTPVTPEPTPITPEPTPVTPEPTPVTPEPTPVTPEPEPTPVTPEPTPVTPEPEPEPAPVTPEPTEEPPYIITVPEGPGNSGAAKLCNQGGYLNLAKSESPTVPFVNVGECVNYVKNGGVPVVLQVPNP